ncbi:hypothetical protein [Nonomuraea endophytica]|uniref:hypothetical protein n=1 Tax=Nonomuraea endophytica TaxID=714136 RepID=UPI0037CBE7A9
MILVVAACSNGANSTPSISAVESTPAAAITKSPSAPSSVAERHWIEGDDPVMLIRASRLHYTARDELTLGYDVESKCLIAPQRKGMVALVWPTGSHPVNENGRRGVSLGDKGRAYVGDKIAVVGGFENWNKQILADLKVPAAVEKCLGNVRSRDVFIIGSVESVKRAD